MADGSATLQPPLSTTERKKMDEDVRKTAMAFQREVERRRAVNSLTEEHVRFTARYDALYLATLYKELNEAKLPEGVIRSIIGRSGRDLVDAHSAGGACHHVAGHGDPEGQYEPEDGPSPGHG